MSTQTAAQTDSQGEQQMALKLYEFTRRYMPDFTQAKPDILEGRYQLDLGAPLPDLDQPSARAYVAVDMLDSDKRLYALICHTGSLPRYRTITALKPLGHPNALRLMSSGVVRLSTPPEERYALIYERPLGRKLSELLPNNPGMRNHQFICERIITPLASAIQYFSENGVSHGLLNPDNVYFGEQAVLGPSAAEPCGMSQPFYFETVERMQALPAGKGEGTAAQDFYALGVLVLYLLKGREHFAGFTEQKLIQDILSDGVYAALTRNQIIPDMFNDLFLGLFSQNPEDRWGWRHIKPWLDGKRFNALTPPSPSEGQKPFEFAGVSVGNRRELAHMLATRWEQMSEPLHSGALAHWASVSLRNKQLADTLARIGRTAGELSGKNEIQHSEQLMRAILLLDPAGPVRFRQIAMHIDGLDTLCATQFLAGRTQELQYIAKFIEFDMAGYWLDIQRRGRDFVMPPAVNAVIMKLDRLRSMIRLTGLGFGMERVLYELNPEMPCISPLFVGAYVNTLPALLKHLDRLASLRAKDDEPLDRHIAAFIAAKLSIQHEIRLNNMEAVPQMAQNRSVIALNLLAMAQHRGGNIQLPGLTHWLALRVLPLLDTIHSKSLRTKMRKLLQQQADSGYTQLLAELIINPNYALADQKGFARAQAQYLHNAKEIDLERRGVRIDQQSGALGLRIARVFALIGFLFAVFKVTKDFI